MAPFLLVLPTLLGGCDVPDRHLTPWNPDAPTRARDREMVVGEIAGMAKPLPPEGDHPDLVLIVLDTVRADHLGVYGYPGATSPHLDRWAAGARVYDRMRANSPWTLPSHASMFTGLFPAGHGAHGVDNQKAAGLRSGSATLARALRSADYVTAGIAANQAFLDRNWGLAQGFGFWMCEQIVDDPRPVPYPPADRITNMAIDFLERRPPGPTFLFLNYMDAHSPWIPREGYVAVPERIDRRVLPFGSTWDEIKLEVMGDRALAPTTQAAWVEAYDSELRYLDEHLGRLLDALPRLGIDEADHVVIVADHGEYLGEHFLVEHSKDVYETVLHVPLIWRGRGVPPGRTDVPIQHTGLADLLLDAAGLPPLAARPAPTDPGLQVAELYHTRKRELQDPRYRGRFNRIRRAFRDGPHTLLLGSDGSREAYDLRDDPGQQHPVEVESWLPDLQSRAERWMEANQPVSSPAEPVANIEELRALGYVQ